MEAKKENNEEPQPKERSLVKDVYYFTGNASRQAFGLWRHHLVRYIIKSGVYGFMYLVALISVAMIAAAVIAAGAAVYYKYLDLANWYWSNVLSIAPQSVQPLLQYMGGIFGADSEALERLVNAVPAFIEENKPQEKAASSVVGWMLNLLPYQRLRSVGVWSLLLLNSAQVITFFVGRYNDKRILDDIAVPLAENIEKIQDAIPSLPTIRLVDGWDDDPFAILWDNKL